MLALPDSIVLTGSRIELQPLRHGHTEDLRVAVGDLHRLWVTNLPKPENLEAYLRDAWVMRDTGNALPFAIVEKSSGRAIGSTRFANFRREHRGVEIGWTWLAESWQRTFVNTEAKYLLLEYAFEKLDCLRVELKTDVLNERSRRAIERIGAQFEGVFRRHMVMPDGRIRDSAYYSVIDRDWPAVKAELAKKLRRDWVTTHR